MKKKYKRYKKKKEENGQKSNLFIELKISSSASISFSGERTYAEIYKRIQGALARMASTT